MDADSVCGGGGFRRGCRGRPRRDFVQFAAVVVAEGDVRRAAYLGNVVEYDLEVGDHLLTVAEHDPRHAHVHEEGASVPIRLIEDCLYVLSNE